MYNHGTVELIVEVVFTLLDLLIYTKTQMWLIKKIAKNNQTMNNVFSLCMYCLSDKSPDHSVHQWSKVASYLSLSGLSLIN